MEGLPKNPTTCIVCDSYIGSKGAREGRGPATKRCLECAEAGKTPDGYTMKYGSIVPDKQK